MQRHTQHDGRFRKDDVGERACGRAVAAEQLIRVTERHGAQGLPPDRLAVLCDCCREPWRPSACRDAGTRTRAFCQTNHAYMLRTLGLCVLVFSGAKYLFLRCYRCVFLAEIEMKSRVERTQVFGSVDSPPAHPLAFHGELQRLPRRTTCRVNTMSFGKRLLGETCRSRPESSI
jgi:hypothetical protein